MQGRARILVYVRSVSGGAGKNAVRYANILAEAGHDVTFAAGRAPEADRFELRRDLVSAKLGLGRQTIAVGLRLRRVIASLRPEICLVVGSTDGMSIGLLGLGEKPKIVLRETLFSWEKSGRRGWPARHLKRRRLRRAYRRADQVIALTHAMAAQLEDKFAVPPEKITVIPNAVKVPETPPQRPVREGPPTLLCVARLTRQKNVACLLDAFARLRRGRELRLRIAGGGRQRAALETRAQELGIAGDVTFLGQVSDVDAEYRQADLFVLPSLWEGFPNVIIEALAHGVTVVATATPGAAEILEGMGCGRIARLDDAEDLAEQIEAALDTTTDPEGVTAAVQPYSNAAQRERVLSLFDEVSLA